MNASKPTRTLLRDVTPPATLAHQDTIVIDWDSQTPNDLFQTRYELLKATIRQVIFRGGLESYWETNPKTDVRKPSTLLNDLIENATREGLYLLRPQITANELLHSDMSDEAIQLTRPLSDAELVRQAKCIADKFVKREKIIKRPYKRDEAGNLVLRDGKPVRGYKCVGLRVEHPRQNKDINDNLVQGWSSPIDNFVSGIDGRPINGGRVTNYAYAATDAMVNEVQRRVLREVLAEYLGRDDAEWLLDYTDGRYPKSVEGDEMAEALTEKLIPHKDALEKFRSLLT